MLLTAINLVGIAESAKALMLPTLLFVVMIVGTVVVGLVGAHPVATIGTDLGPIHPVEALGVILVLKASAAGCSARQEVLHNQRGLLLAAALRRAADAVVATLPFRLR